MQFISDEFKRVLASKLKAGELGRPRCVVEVDRMVFMPGKTEKIQIEDYNLETEVTIEKHWIEPDSSGNYEGSTKLAYDDLVFPVQGLSYENLTSGYGMRNGKMHRGLDFAPNHGTYPNYGRGLPILAVWDGTVSYVDGNKSTESTYGMWIELTHNNGRKTRYAHLNAVKVKTGDKVEAGQHIGDMGNTGLSMSGKKVVQGSYSNPNSDKSKGKGSHLHFEILERDTKGNYKKVNPTDYFKGTAKAYKPATSIGPGSQTAPDKITGIFGRVVLNESFVLDNWYTNKRYSFGDNFLKYSKPEIKSLGGIGSWHTFKFPTHGKGVVKLRLSTEVNMINEGFLDLTFRSNFKKEQGDKFYITVDDSPNAIANITEFNGVDKIQELNKIFVPKGKITINIHVEWGGKSPLDTPNAKVGIVPKQLSIARFKVQELNKTNEAIKQQQGNIDFGDKQEDFFNYQSGYWEEREVTDFIFSNAPQSFDLTVGDFIYSDTITLDNVMNVDIALSQEQDTSEAIVTLSNIDGFYSPTYNVYNFNELKIPSPFSSMMGGFQVGILSNNTPIRIYMGYGNNLIRVFTGLIDKTDMTNNPPTITVTARDMYKKISDKVLTVTKRYPDVNYIENVPEDGKEDSADGEVEKVAWLKSAVVQDLIEHAGMFGWRAHREDFQYPDAVIEESYLISVDQEEGTYVRAVPGKEGEFEVVSLDSIPTFSGWLNPYTDDYGRTFEQYQYRVGEAISEVLKDTHYRSYCDRYGTYRLETPNYNKPIVSSYIYGENITQLDSTIDFSRARSHIIVKDANGKIDSFMDKEILMELKGEIRTASVDIPWAKSYELKKKVASRLFQDMKRVCRTVQVASECNPALDLLDRVRIIDRDTSTNAVYTIKGMRFSYSPEGGLLQFLELFWSEEGQVF